MRYTIVILLFFTVQLINAQQGFIKEYNLGYTSGVGFTAMVKSEEGVVVFGFLKDSILPARQGMLFAEIDTLGEIINLKTHFDPLGLVDYLPGDIPSGFIRLEDGSGYLALGSYLQTSGGYLIKFNNEGDVLWEQEYEDSSALQGFYSRILETETGYLLLGRKQMVNGSQGDIFLIKTDKNGNKLWEKNYGLSSRDDDANNLLRISNNEYIIGGHIGPNQGVPWEEWHHQIQIFAVDSLGNEKWYWESDPMEDENSESDMSLRGLERDEVGNWTYMTSRGEHYVLNNSYQYTNTQAQFVVRDSNFNIIVEQVYEEIDGPTNAFLNMISLSDGDWLGLGVNLELGEHNYGWMGRISNGQDGMTNLGDSLWMRNDIAFPDSQFITLQTLHSAIELPSGSIIAAGYYESWLQGDSDHGLLIKVNQHGCIDTIDCIPKNFPNIVISNKEVANPDFKVYPNPTRHVLHIASEERLLWGKIELLDMRGQVLKTVFSKEEIVMEDLPSGMYVLRLWKDGRFWTRRVVRQ